MAFNEDFYIQKIKTELKDFNGDDIVDESQINEIVADIKNLKKRLHLRPDAQITKEIYDLAKYMKMEESVEADSSDNENLQDESISNRNLEVSDEEIDQEHSQDTSQIEKEQEQIQEKQDEEVEEQKLEADTEVQTLSSLYSHEGNIEVYDLQGNQIELDIRNRPKLFDSELEIILFDENNLPILSNIAKEEKKLYTTDDFEINLDDEFRPEIFYKDKSKAVINDYWIIAQPREVTLNINLNVDPNYINYKKEIEKANNNNFYKSMRKHLKIKEETEIDVEDKNNYGFYFFKKISDWINEEQKIYFRNKD